MKNIGYKVIFKQKEFMKTVIADIVNRFGDSIDTIAFVWLVYQVTQSAAWSAILVPFNSLSAPLISEVLRSDELMMSVLYTAISVGMIIGAALYPYLSGRLSKRAIVIISGYSIGLYYFTFILTGSFISSAILKYIIIGTVSFIIGAAIALLSSMCSVEFMKNVREEYLARSSALFNAVCTAATPVASFIISAIAGFTSTAVMFIISGILDILICAILCRKKLFSKMNEERAGGAVYEEVSDSTESQSDGGSLYTPV